MTGRVFLAGLLGGIVLFLWGGLTWMVLPKVGLDLHQVKPLPGAEATIKALDDLKLDDGVYWGAIMKPNASPDEDSMSEIDETQPAAPFIVWRPEGIGPSQVSVQLAGGFLLCLLQALLAAFLLNIAAPVIRKGYGGRVLFVFWLGVFASLTVHLMYLNWMMFPLAYSFGMIADTLIAWLLVGIVLGVFIRPATAQNPSAATAL